MFQVAPVPAHECLLCMQSKFRGSTATLMGSADCRSLAAGLENCRFEGPVRLHVPISQRLGKVDPDGSFAISLPLPSGSQTVCLCQIL